MDIVIAGCGKVGRAIIEQLSKEGHNIAVVDIDPKVIQKTADEYDIRGIVGNGANYDVQKEAETGRADLLIACTSSDELNILCCLVAKKLGADDTIARIRNPEYFTLFMGNELGLSMMVNPEYEAAMEISRILRFPTAIKVDNFAEGKVELIEIKLSEDNPIAGMKLMDIVSKYQFKLLICAVQRDEEVIIPSGNFTLAAGDKINVTGSHGDIYNFCKKLGILKDPIKKVMVIGGGRIAFYLASQLKKLGIGVKIIEIDENACHKLVDALPKVDIVQGDGSDQELLISEGLDGTDALVVLSGIDEQNILISLFANKRGIKKVITKVNKETYYPMLESSGVESIISPKSITASQIARYVRGKENSLGSSVITLYRLVNNKAEALEFLATSGFKALSTPLKAMKLKKNILIACILRQNLIITPNGNDTIENGDRVILVAANCYLDDLNDILE